MEHGYVSKKLFKAYKKRARQNYLRRPLTSRELFWASTITPGALDSRQYKDSFRNYMKTIKICTKNGFKVPENDHMLGSDVDTVNWEILSDLESKGNLSLKNFWKRFDIKEDLNIKKKMEN